jgi:hypothetical protein
MAEARARTSPQVCETTGASVGLCDMDASRQRAPLEIELLISRLPAECISHACPCGFELAQPLPQVSAVTTAFSTSVQSHIVRQRPVYLSTIVFPST